MEEIILLKRFILDSPAKNSEHIQAISWINRLEQRIKQLEQQIEKDGE